MQEKNNWLKRLIKRRDWIGLRHILDELWKTGKMLCLSMIWIFGFDGIRRICKKPVVELKKECLRVTVKHCGGTSFKRQNYYFHQYPIFL